MDRLEHANRSDFHCARAVRRLLKVTKSEKCTSDKKSLPGAVYVEYYWENREQRKLFSEATRHVVLAFLSVLSAHLAIPKDSL